MSKDRKTLGTPVSNEEYKAFEVAASERGITISALMYTLLHEHTNGFQVFNIPARLPRGFIVRNKMEV